MQDIDAISGAVIDVALRLHRDIGSGLLESVYETLLAARLASLGFEVARQVPIDIEFEGLRFDGAFKIDVLVARTLVVEIKSVDRLNPVHAKQLLTYLRLMKQPVGLLLNFGGETLREGIRRVVNDYRPSAPPRLCAQK